VFITTIRYVECVRTSPIDAGCKVVEILHLNVYSTGLNIDPRSRDVISHVNIRLV